MKLWKVRVNNFGWNSTRTFFAASRKECEEIADKFPASDDVEYAGNFSEAKMTRRIQKNEENAHKHGREASI